MSTTMTRVPARVREQEEAAERAIAEARKAEEAEAAEATAAAAGAPTNQPPPPEPVAGRSSLDDLLEDGSHQPTPGNQPTDLQQRIQLLEDELKAERQRRISIEGRIETEGPRNAELIRDLKDQLRQIKFEREAATRIPGWQRNLTEDERQQFADPNEAMGIAGRAALGAMEERIEARLAKLESELETARGAANRSIEVSREQQILDALEKQIPGAKEINANDPLFARFLQAEREPNSGMTWGEIAGPAFRKGDVDRLVKVFNAYLGASGQDGTRESTRRRMVRPEVAGGNGGLPGGNGKTAERMIKTSEINQFYDDVRRGKYKGRETDQRKLEDAIDRAAEQGRIVKDT